MSVYTTMSRCAHPTELGSHFSCLQCQCGEFLDRPGPGSWVCRGCGKSTDLTDRLLQLQELGEEVERAGAEEVGEVLGRLEREEGVHANHWLRLRGNIRYCDLMKVNN